MEKQLEIGDHVFAHVCTFEPELDDEGKVRAFYPQLETSNSKLEIHSYGSGPFCKFRILKGYSDAGVYVLTVSPSIDEQGSIKYIGECRNLGKRYNAGYGNISPRNCFKGGQRTNCRVNNFIYDVVKAGQFVNLWFLPTNDYKTIEAELICDKQPSWNRKGLAY